MSLEDRLQNFEKKLAERAEIHRELHWLQRSLWVAGGFLLLGAGLAMLVLPGPGLLAIALGLGILALEFAWAEWLLHRAISGGVKVGSLLSLRRIIIGLLLLGVIAGAAVMILLV